MINPDVVGTGIFPPLQKATVKAIACELPAMRGLPFSRFSTVDIAQIAIREGIVESISPTTIWRWLDEDAIRPWYQQSWVFPRDSQFLTKAQPILELYQGFWQSDALTDYDFVISADEKSIQVLSRCGHTAAVAGRIGRYDYQYERHGTITYLAALDVFSGKVFGRTADGNGILPFSHLIDDVMSQEPYQSANRVFWIIDNGPAHHPNTFGARLQADYPNAFAIHLPTHASWLNQIEIYFSIVTRKLLKPNDFDDLEDMVWRLINFEAIYNETSEPFNWKFTRDDLQKRFRHIDQTLYGIKK
jgi:hypothetical protein